MEQEIWKSVPSLDGLLQVSNLGNVREYVEAIVNNEKIVYKNRILRSMKNNRAKVIFITYKNRIYVVSRLVAETFIKDFSQSKCVKYIDNDFTNIKLENIKLSKKTNIGSFGTKNKLAKLTDNDILEICKKVLSGESTKSVAEQYDIAYTNIHRILRKEIWKHVDRPIIKLRELNYNKKNRKLIQFLGQPIKYKQKRNKINKINELPNIST